MQLNLETGNGGPSGFRLLCPMWLQLSQVSDRGLSQPDQEMLPRTEPGIFHVQSKELSPSSLLQRCSAVPLRWVVFQRRCSPYHISAFANTPHKTALTKEPKDRCNVEKGKGWGGICCLAGRKGLLSLLALTSFNRL